MVTQPNPAIGAVIFVVSLGSLYHFTGKFTGPLVVFASALAGQILYLWTYQTSQKYTHHTTHNNEEDKQIRKTKTTPVNFDMFVRNKLIVQEYHNP